MPRSKCHCLFVSFLIFIASSMDAKQYLEKRQQLIQRDDSLRLGSQLVLSKDENTVNGVLQSYKLSELREASSDDGVFLPAHNFVKHRKEIRNSKVHQMIKTMPKGGLLHLHDLSMTSPLWLIKNATYRDDCYMCEDSLTGNTFFKIVKPAPEDTRDCKWKLVNDERQKSTEATDFDETLANKITIINYSMQDHEKKSQSKIWKAFNAAFAGMVGLVFHPDILPEYFREGLAELYGDGGIYCEVVNSEGKVFTKDWVVQQYIRVIEEFKETHANFLGAKLIYSDHRSSDELTIKQSVLEAIELHLKYPDYVIGYDLVGREDSGNTLKFFLKELLTLPQQHNVTLPFFFHAGETDWQDMNVDDNLFDAILLNSSRIGHGFALVKHPFLMQIVKEREIAIEINPISNQVLLLVDDLRNHPGTVLIGNNVPCVVSSDDPAMWGALPLTDDYYATFMALCGARADLRTLKQLFLNSLRYNGMNRDEKAKAILIYEKIWSNYINDYVRSLRQSKQ